MESPRVPYIYMVQMDIPAEHEAAFNRIYDTEHVPEILKVPGVRACSRTALAREQRHLQAFAASSRRFHCRLQRR